MDSPASPRGANIEDLRYRAGLTQTELAKALGFHQYEISKYERGKVDPSPRRYRQIVDYLEAVIAGTHAHPQDPANDAA